MTSDGRTRNIITAILLVEVNLIVPSIQILLERRNITATDCLLRPEKGMGKDCGFLKCLSSMDE